jgi:anti-sigma B factor antagonist
MPLSTVKRRGPPARVTDPSSRTPSPEPKRFGCDVQTEGDVVRVVPTGDLDMATAPLLDARLAELRRDFRQLILDLSRLDFIDSTGLRLLLRYDAEARQDGFNLRLIPGPPAVQRVFELTGTLRLLPFTDV